MRYLSKLIALLVFSSLKLTAQETHEEAQAEEKNFHWTKEKTEFANVQVQVAGPGMIQNFIQVSGKIMIHPDRLAYVIPKVTGSVYEVRKNLGDPVEKGETLALIESKEIAEARAAYLIASKKYFFQQTLLNKERALKGISSGQDYLNAELSAAEAEIELKLASQHLFALGFTEHEINKIVQESPADYRYFAIKSPLKGKVLQRNLTQGEWIDTSKQIFTVGNFEKVWVEINVSQSDVHYLKEGLPVEINAGHGKLATVEISQFAPTISEETRTATAIALMDNNKEEWSPGQFVTAHIQTDAFHAAVVVPLAAIQMIKGDSCVFVEEGQEFIPCMVKLGKMDKQNVEIVSGLSPGISYAAFNTFCLKADYEKEEAEDSH